MKALVWKGERQLDYEVVPEPAPGEGEVLAEVRLAGICGSDLHGYRGHPGPRVPPLVLGHEAVVLADGARHVLYPLIGCGICERCAAGEVNLCPQWRLIGMHRPGVFAERLAVPSSTLIPVPDDLPDERAVLAEPLACAVGALAGQEISGAGTRVVVIGCGPIGLLSVMLAALRGAAVTAVDPLEHRRQLALGLGAQASLAPEDVVGDLEADLVVDAAGFSATWGQAIAAVRSGGQIIVLGLGDAEGRFPMALVVRRGLSLRGQFAYSREDFHAAVQTLADPRLSFSWLEREPLSRGARSFASLVEEPARHVKILLEPGA